MPLVDRSRRARRNALVFASVLVTLPVVRPPTSVEKPVAPEPEKPVAPEPACRARLNVAPGGNDAGQGSASDPLLTIQRAADLVIPGDTVCVAPGTYRERVHVTRSGTAAQPITFVGAAGVVVDGGDPHGNGWISAPEMGRDARGATPVWKKRIAFAGGATPEHATLEGKYLLKLRDHEDDGTPFMSDCEQRPATCTGSDRLRNGPRGHATVNPTGTPLQGWSSPGTVDAMFGVAGGWTYIAFRDGGSANGRDLTFAPGKAGAFTVDASYVTVRGFALRGANHGVYLPSERSHHVVVEDNTVRNGFHGILLAGGAHDNVVRRNDISLDYGHSLDPSDRWHWFTWRAFRSNSELARGSVMLSGSGAGNEIAANTIHEAFDGIGEDGTSNGGARTRVLGNTIRACLNDGLTITGGPESEWSGNAIRDVNVGTRFWPLGDAVSVSYHRNSIEQADSELVEGCLFFFRGSASARLRVYQNTCTGPLALLFGSTDVGAGLPGLVVSDNVLATESVVAFNDWDGWKASFANPARRPRIENNQVAAAVPDWVSTAGPTRSR